MEQGIYIAQSGKLILQATITIPAETRKPVLIFKGPTQLLLTAGIALDVDGSNKLNLPFYTCDRINCYARAEMEEAAMIAMTNGGNLNVLFKNLTGETIKVEMPLNGFTAAYNMIK